MRKGYAFLISAIAAMLLFTGCHPSNLSFTAGSYIGTAQGKNGQIKVEVSVDEDSINSIKIVENHETEGLADTALKLIPAEIIKNQSLAVDTVSGATIVSDAIKEAVKNALEPSGVDLKRLSETHSEAHKEKGSAQKTPMAPGVYTGSAYGKWAKGSNEGARFGSPKVIQPITVDVKVDEDSILDVTVTNCDDTPGFKEPAIERMQKDIVEKQSIAVDVVSGCTMTCRGIISAVTQAMEQAGADFTDFNAKTEKRNSTEEYTADVVIAGGGTAGTAAALAAIEKGANVVIVEKTGKIGGMGVCSTGFIGVESSFTKAAGSKVTVDEVFKEMMEYSDWTANPLIVKTILEKSGDTADWLAAHGYKLKIGGYGYTHDTGKGTQKMQDLYDNYILPAGAKLLLETSATELLIDGARVTGLKAVKKDGTVVTVHADAVIIATGGFGGNPEMLERYTGSSNYYLSGLSASTGDGLNMALSAGAMMNEEIFPHLTEFAASTTLDYNSYFMKYLNYGGLLQVNIEGKRFMDEGLCAEQPLAKGASAIRTAGSFYVIFDQATLDTLHTQGFPGLFPKETTEMLKKTILWRGRALVPFTSIMDEMQRAMDAHIACKGSSIEELESQMGVEKDVLVNTVARYKQMVDQKQDDDFYKNPVWLTQTINGGPYYAVRMEPAIFGTSGGIKVNEQFQVVNKELQPIAGLYAAGQDTGGFMGYPYYDIPGCTMGYSYNSGRIAGEHAVDYSNRN
ncbi:FAD-binding protein [Sediminispirochaeta smaragdinae]|uniref:Fumarate reductase/succinate dehydrogenase flavoprotein domain protein n=1 Tax=Sediminispirochaeta smaragdinae (strain DSM 11293 / JCM 15392 / SEBR 4228) TaxID=573413 RepID=E1RCB5_SEDSS|nr:FAD-binding protein [Sediminispirochaeta smaragdinae]ADK79995.1 fumarate reductase/succinate dehydrogenase flavoprotein domain protein [Sediminispirochaeta smaragdinae DSM 11293]